ncbi:hypothetical protein D9619_006869 [Psilocybe cf. subviscida]|uniref:Mid2 domain-containing protein n=1 Tax=Psilocybe cf. subviscida TaxID=2480587 RepID=A0A8H5B4W1_9AGAR|nr:hypothetical protein D9619_006869 [Psilocybe cf. subviscida]
MPQQVSIDDTNTTLIQYSGTWEPLVGSTRQWEGTSHVSLDPGASATFSFRGYQVWVWGTIPAGTGSNLYDVAIDGGTPNVTSRTSNGSANYNDVYYQSSLLRDTYHTVVIRNLGSSANANTEVQLDRFMFETNDEIPRFTPPGGPITSGASSTGTLPSASTSPSITPSPQATSGGSSSTTRVGAIAGAVIGVLVVIIIVLGFFLWKRKKASKQGEMEKATGGRPASVTAVPFPLEPAPAGHSPSGSDPRSVQTRDHAHTATGAQSQSTPLSEKARYIRQSAHDLSGAGPMPTVTSPSTTSSSALSPGSTASVGERSLQHQPSLGMSDMSSMYAPHVPTQTHGGFQRSVTDVTSSIPEADEAMPVHPPPAYSNGARDDSPLIP